MLSAEQCDEVQFIVDNKQEKSDLPRGYFKGKIVVVDNVLMVQQAVDYLNTQTIIGFDTETKPRFIQGSPKNHVALLQMTTHDHAYLFRINKIGLPKNIAALLENKNILKIGAAVHDDLRQLQTVCYFRSGGFVDIQRVVSHYGIEEKGVKKLAARVLQISISKSQQLSNWENNMLSPEQCLYAATDAWVCREIFVCLQKIRPLAVIEMQQITRNIPKKRRH